MASSFVTAEEAVKLIENGDHVYIQGSTSIPEVLVEALANRADELRDITVYSAFAVARRPSPLCKPEYKDIFHIDSFFVSNAFREWIAQGYGTMTPRFLGEVPELFRDGTCRVDRARQTGGQDMDKGDQTSRCSRDILFV